MANLRVDSPEARATVDRGIFSATAISRIECPVRRSSPIRFRSPSVGRGGRPQARPSAASRSRAALIRSLMARRSILAAQAMTARDHLGRRTVQGEAIAHRHHLGPVRPQLLDHLERSRRPSRGSSNREPKHSEYRSAGKIAQAKLSKVD